MLDSTQKTFFMGGWVGAKGEEWHYFLHSQIRTRMCVRTCTHTHALTSLSHSTYTCVHARPERERERKRERERGRERMLVHASTCLCYITCQYVLQFFHLLNQVPATFLIYLFDSMSMVAHIIHDFSHICVHKNNRKAA